MRTTTTTTRRVLALVAGTALLLGAVACSDDDGDASSSSTTTAATTGDQDRDRERDQDRDGEQDGDRERDLDRDRDAGAAADPYDGHSSEVYDAGEAWLCRPDLADDVCRDLDVTEVTADGERSVEERQADPEAPIDCFYVYPTVSADPTPNADMEVAPEDPETSTVVAQAAPFASTCRVFAPIYRQATLRAIGDASFGEAAPIAYGDVLDAWKTYVSTWNDGRGVILVGHSQGTGHLSKLIADEIDDDETLRSRLVAAYLFGGAVQVPEGEVVGGDFRNVPGCRSADEVGCVVTWSTYAEDRPPVEAAIFGRAGGDVFSESQDAATRALCVDAVSLLGRDHASPLVPSGSNLIRVEGTDDVATPFVLFPDALEVSCSETATHDYLAVSVAGDADARPLDGLLVESLGETWGLHLVDMTVAMGDLVDLAERQAEAYAG